MAARMVSRFFVTYPDAAQAVADLTAAGIPAADISLIQSEEDARLPPDVALDAAQAPAVTGATLGAGIGGGIGVLFGVGAIAIPVFDPVVQFGWLAPTLIGALLGAGAGALFGIATRLGVTNQQAHAFAEGLQRGEYLVMVRADESRAGSIQQVMARTQARRAAEAPALDAALPDGPDETPEDPTEAMGRTEARIQYISE